MHHSRPIASLLVSLSTGQLHSPCDDLKGMFDCQMRLMQASCFSYMLGIASARNLPLHRLSQTEEVRTCKIFSQLLQAKRN